MADKPIEIFISPGGQTRHTYSKEAVAITEPIGPQEIRRATHVEPTYNLSDAAVQWYFEHGAGKDLPVPFDVERRIMVCRLGSELVHHLRKVLPSNKWWSDLMPSGGGVLGPFDTNEQALAAELQWLSDNHCPPVGEIKADAVRFMQEYGGGPAAINEAMAEKLGMTVEEAQRTVEQFRRKYPQFDTLLLYQAKETGRFSSQYPHVAAMSAQQELP